MDWPSAALWINRAVKYSTSIHASSSAAELGLEGDGPVPGNIETVDVWSQTAPAACQECRDIGGAQRSIVKGRIWNESPADGRPRRPRLLATASAPILPSGIIAGMIASRPRAAWPLAGKG
eukprot:5982125-Heterocapsa_arctica.AAC.1